MLSLTDVEARKLDAENEREMRISNGNNDRDEDDIHDNSWNGKMTETDGMISFSMMILLLYLPLPLRYKWAIWSEEEVQIYIQQKCFSVFFSLFGDDGPPFSCACRAAHRPFLLVSSSTCCVEPLPCPVCTVYMML